MANEKDPIVYRYKPTHPDEGIGGVPRRDLRQSDVDALEGRALRDVTAPDVEEPIYRPVEHDHAAAKLATEKKGGD